MNRKHDPLPWWTRPLLALTPHAEREELREDLADEYRARQKVSVGRARWWLFRQATLSLPAAFGRTAWRASTGFEPKSSAYRPGGFFLEAWIIDLRFALRTLRKRPAFTGTTIATLALGVAGVSAIGSILLPYLKNPLPYADEQRLVQFWDPHDWAEAEHSALRPDYPGFEAVAAYSNPSITLTRPGEAARSLEGVAASWELFDVLGSEALLGETFRVGDDLPGATPVAVLGHRLWQTLGASEDLVGQQIELDGTMHLVRGVMPEGFWFPQPSTEIWTTTAMRPDRRDGNYAMVARIAKGVDAQQLQTPLDQIARRLSETFEYPAAWDKTASPSSTPLRQALLGEVAPMLYATQGAMLLILLAATANVSTLVLGQVGARRQDLSIRSALGAPKRRLFRQLVLEVLLIGLFAGALGATIAIPAFRWLLQTLPMGSLASTMQLDLGVLGIGLGVGLCGALLAAAAPALQLLTSDLAFRWLGQRTSGSSARGGFIEGTLVVAEVALAVLLVVGASLMVRSVDQLRSIDIGLEPEPLAVLQMSAPGQLDRDARLDLLRDLRQQLDALPGVRGTAMVQRLPLSGGGWSTGIEIEGDEEQQDLPVFYRMVTASYFPVLGLEVLAGRGFDEADSESDRGVAVVNQTFVDRYFAGDNPLGRRITNGLTDEWVEVIGVIENEAVAGLRDDPSPTQYLLYEHVPFTPQANNVILATEGSLEPAALLPAARSILEGAAPGLAVERLLVGKQLFSESMGQVPRVMQLLSLLGMLALVLGAIGVYGVVHHFAQSRSREWALRQALGLRPVQILQLVLRRGTLLVTAGLLLGGAAAAYLSRFLSTFLFRIDSRDPQSLVIAALLLLAAGLLAAAVPAARAARTAPATILRN